MSEATLSTRAIRSGRWLLSVRLFSRVLSLTRTVVFARLLAPEDLGQAAVAFLALAIVEATTSAGLYETLVQKRELEDGDLDTAWTLIALRRLVAGTLVFALAPQVAEIIGDATVVGLIRGAALGYIIVGGRNIGLVYLERNVEFRVLVLRGAFLSMFEAGLGIVLVAVLRNAWGLILAFMAMAVVDVVTSYLVHGYRPHVRIDRARLGTLFGFSRWLYGVQVLTMVTNNGDDAIVAARLGVQELGNYQVAYRVTNAPILDVVDSIADVTFPSVSRVHYDIARQRRAFVLSFEMIALVVCLPIAALLTMAPELTEAILGPKWLGAVDILRMMTLWLGWRSIEALTIAVMTAVGRPDRAFATKLLQTVVFFAIVFPMLEWWGAVGVAAAAGIAATIAQIFAVDRTMQLVELPIGPLLSGAAPAVIGGVGAAAAMALAVVLLEGPWLTSLVGGSVGTVVYLCVAWLIGSSFGTGPGRLVRWFRHDRSVGENAA